MEELTKKELAEAKKQARRLRVSSIRRRIATGAVALVAVFSGFALYRSVDQQMSATTTVASTQLSGVSTSASAPSDGSSGDLESAVGGAIVNQVASVFGDDDHDDESDDDEDGSSIFSSSDSMTTSQS